MRLDRVLWLPVECQLGRIENFNQRIPAKDVYHVSYRGNSGIG